MVNLAEAMGAQNPWWLTKNAVKNHPIMQKYEQAKFRKPPNLIHMIQLTNDALYTLSGPRQIGKSTSLILIIKKLIDEGNDPADILYFSCENLKEKRLQDLIEAYLAFRSDSKKRKFIFLDEISHAKDWTEDFLALTNQGKLKDVTVIASGSHAMEISESVERLPGRRGQGQSLDKVLLPMKFSEYLDFVEPNFKTILFNHGLKKAKDRHDKFNKIMSGEIPNELEKIMQYKKFLDDMLNDYLISGGIPSVINEHKVKGEISNGTFITYYNGLMGDFKKIGLKDDYVKQIVRGLIETYRSPISWNALTKKTELGSHNTIDRYTEGFGKLFFANKVFHINQNAEPEFSKDKKVYFQDPFFFNLFCANNSNPENFYNTIKLSLLNNDHVSSLAETITYNHLCRLAYQFRPNDLFQPTEHIFYHRTAKDKETDFVLLYNGKMNPLEVKYQEQITSSDYGSLQDFKCGALITKNTLEKNGRYVAIPLSIFLLLI